MILYTIISPEDIFYTPENKKNHKTLSEKACITAPYEYIKNDEYSRACMELYKSHKKGSGHEYI